MSTQQDVSETRNAYHAFMACLCITQGRVDLIDTLIVPGLCTGWGKMPATKAATQIREAFDDYIAGRTPEGSVNLPARHGNTLFRAVEPMDE